MHALCLPTLLSAALLAALPQFAREVRTIALGADAPVLAGHGPAQRLEITIDADGFLDLWAESKTLDPFLRVEDTGGKLLAEDDDSAGAKRPWIELVVAQGQKLVLQVASSKPAGSGTLELHLQRWTTSPAERELTTRSEAALEEVRKLQKAKDLAGARKQIEAALGELVAAAATLQGPAIEKALWNAEDLAAMLGCARASIRSLERLVALSEARYPADHLQVADTWNELGAQHYQGGNMDESMRAFEKALSIRERVLDEDAIELQKSRANLASLLRDKGRPAEARPLQEKALAAFERTLSADHKTVQIARISLANTLNDLGESARAEELARAALDACERTLAPGDPLLENVRVILSDIYSATERYAQARPLLETVLERRRARLPADHPLILRTRQGLGIALSKLGDLEGARAELETALDGCLRTEGERQLAQDLRLHLGRVLLENGQVEGARVVWQRALDNDLRLLPEDNVRVQRARGNLAVALQLLGDLTQARELQERVLEVMQRIRGPDHKEVQYARIGLANTLKALGQFDAALALLQTAREVFERTLREDHPDLHYVLTSTARLLIHMGNVDEAGPIAQKNLELVLATLPEGSEGRYFARELVSETLRARGQAEAAYRLMEEAASELSLTHSAETLVHQQADCFLAQAAAGAGHPDVARRIALATAVHLRRRLASVAHSLAPRALEQFIDKASLQLRTMLQLASTVDENGELDRACFATVETVRGAALRRARGLMLVADDEEARALRVRVAESSAEVARRARSPAAGSLADAVRAKEAAESELSAKLAQAGDDGAAWEADLAAEIAARLAPDQAAVACCTAWFPGGKRILAWVLRKDAQLVRVDLGTQAEIVAASDAWRAELRASRERGMSVEQAADKELETGRALRKLLIDPLLPALGDARRVVIAPDDELYSVPLDALPLEGTGADGQADPARLGDRLAIEIQPTLWQLVQPLPALKPVQEPELVVLGAIEYDQSGDGAGAPKAETRSAGSSGSWSREFLPLPETSAEARTIVQLFEKSFGKNAQAKLRDGAAASRAELVRLAPGARYLHIATHGFFAPDSVSVDREVATVDLQLPELQSITRGEQALGLSPMVLCGLALSGANLPPDEHGRIAGVITGEELATLDLRGCELAVLSACDTSNGTPRGTGQGIASLQHALQLAGARAVITSLWKVNDEATRELMTDFYRRIWVEKKDKGRALWESKLRVREKKDSKGRRVYAVRDWASWVLSGS